MAQGLFLLAKVPEMKSLRDILKWDIIKMSPNAVLHSKCCTSTICGEEDLR